MCPPAALGAAAERLARSGLPRAHALTGGPCEGTAAAACWRTALSAQPQHFAGALLQPKRSLSTPAHCRQSSTRPVTCTCNLLDTLLCCPRGLRWSSVSQRRTFIQLATLLRIPVAWCQKFGEQAGGEVSTCSHCMVGDVDRKAWDAAESSPGSLWRGAEMGCSREPLPAIGGCRRSSPEMGALAWDCSSAACASTGFICHDLPCSSARLGESMKEADRRAGSRGLPPRLNISCSSAETARADTLEAQGETALSCMDLHALLT